MSVFRFLSLSAMALLLATPETHAQEAAPPLVVRMPSSPASNDGKVDSERNVRIDVTVTVKSIDKSVTKSLSLVAADGKQVQGRAGVQLPVVMSRTETPVMRAEVSYREVGINVDAAPRILPSGKISVSIKLNFSNVIQVQGASGERPSFGSGAQEANGIVFDSGKPLILTQATDGETGREHTVTITATILK